MALFSIVANGSNLGAFSEGATASVQFDVLDEYGVVSPTGLPSASTVSASIVYLGSSSADITAGSFQYSMDNSIWQNVVGNSITINTGFPSFWLRVGLVTDAFQEPFDALTFVVSQTYQSVGLTDSWYVPYTFDITDTTALSVLTVDGAATANVNEGAVATATFNVSGAGLATATQINAQMTFVGASTLDFTGAMTITTFGGGSPLAAVNVTALNGLVTLPVGTTSFTLSRPTKDDGVSEYFESMIVSVAQTSLNGGLTDSWYVAKTLNLIDNAGAPLVSVTAVAPGAPAIGGWTPPATDTASEGNRAIAAFQLSSAVTVAGEQLDARIIGVGATLGSVTGDYSDFKYETFDGTNWSNGTVGGGTAVPGSGHILLPVGTTAFRLSALLTLDNKTEFAESLIFAVNQTSASKHLTDSWWVQNTVQIADVSTTATTFTGAANSDHFNATTGADLFVIPAGSSPAVEGYYDWITGLGGLASGDKIDIQGGLGGAEFRGPVAFNGSVANAITQAGTVGADDSDVVVLTNAGHTYLFVDTNGSGTFTADDTFIKLVSFTGITTTGDLNTYLVNHSGATGLFGVA